MIPLAAKHDYKPSGRRQAAARSNVIRRPAATRYLDGLQQRAGNRAVVQLVRNSPPAVARKPESDLDDFLLDSNLPKRSLVHGGARSHAVPGGVVLEVVRQGVIGRAFHHNSLNSVSGRETKQEIAERRKIGLQLTRATVIASVNNRRMKGSTRIAFVIVEASNSRYLRYGDKGVLIVSVADDVIQAGNHEATHGVLDSYETLESGGGRAGKSASRSLDRIADLFLKLSRTKPLPGTSRAVGLAMVDPSWWSKGAAEEHPWENYDEFFATAYGSFVNRRKLFLAGLRKASAVDSSVRPLSLDLLRILRTYHSTGRIPPAKSASPEAALHRSRTRTSAQVSDPKVIRLLKFKP